jgi:diaminopimelate epimerase
MASIPFYKYQGTGNDFIVVDNRELGLRPKQSQIVAACDRKFGVGSDGLILIEKGDGVDFYMNFFNPDGSQSFCGNGSRCAVRFFQAHLGGGDELLFGAIDGVHSAKRAANGWIEILMRPVSGVDRDAEDFVVQTGSPHFVKYVENTEAFDLIPFARGVRYGPVYGEKGINVNVVEEATAHIRMRTYERGVEDETLSCGTGVTAAALTYALKHEDAQEVEVITRGGALKVKWERHERGFKDILLCGPAQEVFSGQLPEGAL